MKKLLDSLLLQEKVKETAYMSISRGEFYMKGVGILFVSLMGVKIVVSFRVFEYFISVKEALRVANDEINNLNVCNTVFFFSSEYMKCHTSELRRMI